MPRSKSKKSYQNYFQNLNKSKGIILLILFFLSRVFFINAKEVFFDSKEYLNLFVNPSLYQAIIDGHSPIHEGYIYIFWPIYQLAQFFRLAPGYTVVLGETALSTITIYCFYKSIEHITDKKIALFSSIIISLTPLFWITNVTITLEASYLSFYFLSLFLLTRYLIKNKLYFLILSFICYAYAFITYSAVLLWLPVYLVVVFYQKRQMLLKIFLGIGIVLFITLTLRLVALSIIFHGTPLRMLHDFYFSNITDAAGVPNNLQGLLIRIRDFIPILRSYTSLIFILSIISLIYCYFKNKKIFFVGLLWIIPILYTNQWWDSLLMGRYSILAGFGFSLLTGYLINRYKFIAPIVILNLLVVSLPALFLLRTDTPYIKEEHFAKTLPKNSLLIDSQYAVPVLEKCCDLKILGVNRPDYDNAKLQKTINEYLKNKKPIFVSSAALSDPYGLFEGPYLHPLSLSYNHQFEFNRVLTNYSWKIFKVIDSKDNLIMYQIIAHGKSSYPTVMNLNKHYRRLDYYDPITRLWWYGEDLFNSGKKK